MRSRQDAQNPWHRRPVRALTLALCLVAASAAVSTAGTGDALIGGTADGTAATQYSGVEKVAQCPAEQRALGGGIAQAGAAVDDLVLRASGPLDDSGTMAGTKNGDRPTQWYAAASNETTDAVSFRVFAVCADANAKVAAKNFSMPTGESKTKSVGCPKEGQRVVGGGVIQNGGYGGSFVRESGPTDATGTFRHTREGDVAERWTATMHNQGGSTFFKVFAVCARHSGATLEVKAGKLPADVVSRDRVVPCPGAKRALGGGVLHNKGLDGYFSIAPTGPLGKDGVTINTNVGDKPRQWYGGINNIFGSPAAKFKVLAICE